MGFTRRYVSAADQIVRVYAVGGMGTLMEIINGVARQPNVQVAAWPFGIDNAFLRYFGKDQMERFRSLTANAISAAREQFLRAGMNDFLAKPIILSELQAILRKYLPPQKIS